MKGKKKDAGPTDKQLRVLLATYQCPTPFHAVRTRFLGNIAGPVGSPVQAIQALWGGELPEFEDEASAQALLSGLLDGLWNRLSVHQSKRHRFHLTRMNSPTDPLTFARYTGVRREELEGFVDGLFGDEEAMDLPETAHNAMLHLGDIRGLFVGMGQFASDDDLLDDFDSTVKDLVELTRIAEQEIHAAVVSCTQARRQQLKSGLVFR